MFLLTLKRVPHLSNTMKKVPFCVVNFFLTSEKALVQIHIFAILDNDDVSVWHPEEGAHSVSEPFLFLWKHLNVNCGKVSKSQGFYSWSSMGEARADFKVNQVVMKVVSHDPSVESIHLGHGEPVDGNQGFKINRSAVFISGSYQCGYLYVVHCIL